MSAAEQVSAKYTIAHATDLHPEGGVAFRHSVALARDLGAALYSMHANPVSKDVERQIPDANQAIRKWHWAAGKGVDAPSIEFHKMLHSCCEDPVDTLLDAMRRIEPDLLVVGKHPNRGVFELLRESVAEALALNSRIPTLFLPLGSRGFVHEETGEVELERILLPVQDEATFLEAYDTVRELLERMGREEIEVVVLHVGDDGVLDDLMLPESEHLPQLRWEQRQGNLADEILHCIREHDVDLVVMGTHGHDSLGDVFRGSRTERVVRKAPCAVLSVPLEAQG